MKPSNLFSLPLASESRVAKYTAVVQKVGKEATMKDDIGLDKGVEDGFGSEEGVDGKYIYECTVFSKSKRLRQAAQQMGIHDSLQWFGYLMIFSSFVCFMRCRV